MRACFLAGATDPHTRAWRIAIQFESYVHVFFFSEESYVHVSGQANTYVRTYGVSLLDGSRQAAHTSARWPHRSLLDGSIDG